MYYMPLAICVSLLTEFLKVLLITFSDFVFKIEERTHSESYLLPMALAVNFFQLKVTHRIIIFVCVITGLSVLFQM